MATAKVRRPAAQKPRTVSTREAESTSQYQLWCLWLEKQS